MAGELRPQFEVFLSHHWPDQDAAERITRFLQRRGVSVMAERWYADLKYCWPQALKRNLGWCGALVLCLGPRGLSGWQQREVGLALAMQAQGLPLPIIPVLLPGADPAHLFLAEGPWVDLRCSGKEPEKLPRLEALVRRGMWSGRPACSLPEDEAGQNGPAQAEPAEPCARAEFCPYRGLLPFREEDAGLFFGRAGVVAELQALLERKRWVRVVGRRGGGKTSLLQAGLVPRLRRDHQVGWEVALLAPGEQPLEALAGALTPLLYDEPSPTQWEERAETEQMAAQLSMGTLTLQEVVLRIMEKHPGSHRLLLAVDRWEELYTVCQNPPARERFIRELLEATQRTPLRVALMVDEGFVQEARGFEPLDELRLPPLTRAELREAMVRPAGLAGVAWDEPLVERILDDTEPAAENLARFQLTLRRLWEQRRGSRLGLQDYATIGGIQKAARAATDNVPKAPPPAAEPAVGGSHRAGPLPAWGRRRARRHRPGCGT